MKKRRGAPRLTQREDPLSFVLRNRPAREVLERLQGQPLMIPLTLRKALQVHPEAFDRLIRDMDEFALVSIRALPGPRGSHQGAGTILRIPVGIELTDSGRNVLGVTEAVRKTVRRYSRLLPEASVEHWLPA